MQHKIIRNINLKQIGKLELTNTEKNFVLACRFLKNIVKKLNKWQIDDYPLAEYYIKDKRNIVYFEYGIDTKLLSISNEKIWMILEKRYKLNNDLIEICINQIIISYFNIEVENTNILLP